MCEQVGINEDSYSITTSYRIIRKRLDNLGYRQAFSVDTLPLVEKLLADLIKTTESLRHFKAIAQDKIEASSGHQEFSADPYKCDNVKLVQECNQLNGELLKSKENHVKQTKELKKKINTLETECSDLQLASSRNLKRIKDLETESSNKSKRIQELLGKCCKPTVSNSGLIAKKRPVFPLKKPAINGDILTDDLLKGSASIGSLMKIKPEVVDLMAMADRKINSLNHEVIKLKGELELQYDNVHTLKTQLAMKGKEINRLKKMLEGGRPSLAVTKDCSCQNAEPNCIPCTFTNRKSSRCADATMNEIKVLQQVKSNLEQQLREALEKQHDAMSQAMKLAERNEELEKELRDIDHIALAVEADCNSTVKENNLRVSQLQEKLESTMGRVHHLENDLLVEKRASQELRADLEACKLEKRNLQRALDSTTDEKKQLTDRINQLTLIENALNDEINRLSRLNETQKHEIAQLQCVNDSLKTQMSNDSCQILSKSASRVTKDKGDKNDKNQGTLMKKKNGQRRSFSPPVREKGSTESEKARRTIQEKEEKIIDLQNSMDKLRREKEHYREELERLKKESRSDNELWSQICDLRHQLNERETRVSELQREKRELCREKFELESRLQGCKNRKSPCSTCNQCRSVGPCVCLSLSPGPETGSKAFLSRLERERDTARTDVERLTQERDILRERLKMATEAHTCEQRRLRDNVRELENRLEEIERERKEHLLAQGTRRTAIAGLEEQLEEAREELRRTKQELASQRTQYFQLRALQDQTDQALGDVQSQLSQSETELSKAMERNRCLEQQQTQLDNQVRELKQEINALRTSMARLDQEKDQLLVELDNKTERISSLEREILSKEQQTIATEQQLREFQHKYQICTDQSAEQERQLRSMQMEMENNQRQLAAASADRESAAQENRRLQDDLAALTCEIRTLQRELEASRAESYDLKRQLQTYVSEVRRAEELLNRKENERTEMLNHFRSLSLEATVLENNNHSLESEAAEARGALQSARDRLLDLERQLADKDCLIRGYETQITELTQNIASLESQVRQQTEQRARTEADLNAVRDLCVQLDQQKEKLMRELGDRDAVKAQYEAQISRLKAEQNMAQEQVNRDHVTVDRMEQLLDQARQESMDCRAQNQELHNEIKRMKQRICELQNKLSAESAELRRYQNQAAEYSKQISELRRQVTNERFDRARKEEEHRRNSPETNSPPINHAVRFQSSPSPQYLNANVTRYPQSTLQNDYHPLAVSPETPEARRTARLIQGNTYKDSVQTEEDHAIVQLRGPKNGETTHQTISVPGRGSLCISTTLQENEERNSLNVKISDVESMEANSENKNANSLFETREEVRDEDNLQKEEMAIEKSPEKNENDKKACGCVIGTNLPNCPADDNNDPKFIGDSSVKKNSADKSESTKGKSQRKTEKIDGEKSEDLEEKRIQEQNFDENEDIQQLTNPSFIKLLTEMKEYTRNLNDQMALMNSVMQSQNSHLDQPIDQHEINFDKKISYRRVDNNDGNVEDIEGMERQHFVPSRTSTPKKQVDFNDNIVEDEKMPVVVTSEKRVCYKRQNPSKVSHKVEQVIISTSVMDESNEERKKKSMIPTKSSPRSNKHGSSNNSENSNFQAMESYSFLDDASSVRVRSCSFKSSNRDRSKSSSRSQGTYSNKKDAVTQDSPVFYSLPEHSHYSETNRSYRDKSRHSRSHCNREECL